MNTTGDPNIPEDENDLDAEIDLGDDWPPQKAEPETLQPGPNGEDDDDLIISDNDDQVPRTAPASEVAVTPEPAGDQ